MWNGKFNRGKVGFISVRFAPGSKPSGFLKSEKMPLKSALEDLSETTLAGVAGIVGKIDYVASLRDGASGSYSHWGLSRTHGEPTAQRVLAEAHRALFLTMLSTPLARLRDEVVISSGALQIPAGDYMQELRRRGTALLPQDLGGGSARHFNSVLHALSILVLNSARTPTEAIPPV